MHLQGTQVSLARDSLQRLEFLMGFARENGEAADPAELGLPPDIPSQVRHVVTFKPVVEPGPS
jgi:hypothetical protein